MFGAKVLVRYPSSSTDGSLSTVSGLTIREEVNRHTIMILSHRGDPFEIVGSVRRGDPVHINLRNENGDMPWHGYVDSVLPNDPASTTRVICVGVTAVLKASSMKVLSGPLDEVQRGLVGGSRLASVVSGPKGFVKEPMTGRSAWAVLTSLAQEFGQQVFSTGTTVNVLTTGDVVKSFLGSAQSFSWNGAVPEGTKVKGSLDYLAPYETDRSVSVVGSAVDITGVVHTFEREGSGGGTRYDLSSTPRSSELMEARYSAPPVTATAKMSGPGNPLVAAGHPVLVKGSSPGPWWFCRSVEHEYSLDSGEYLMSADLFRTSELDGLPVPTTAPSRGTGRSDSGGLCLCKERHPELQDGKWVRRTC